MTRYISVYVFLVVYSCACFLCYTAYIYVYHKLTFWMMVAWACHEPNIKNIGPDLVGKQHTRHTNHP